jgi:cold shock CspA family protein
MRVPTEITFRDFRKTPAIERLILRKVDKLDKMCGYMTSFHVTVEMPQRHQRRGNPYQVRLEARVPHGHDVVVKRESSKGDMHDSLYTVLIDAFDAMERQMRKIIEKQHLDVKTHPEQQAEALVVKLFREEGYGFLKTADGRDIYFHRNSVLDNGFDRIEIGTGVRFVEEMGIEGPQASTVRIVDKPGVSVPSMEERAVKPPMGWA